jgi:hypothetical protein
MRSAGAIAFGLMIAWLATPANSQKEVVTQQGGGIAIMVVVVPPRQLDMCRAIELSRKFLAENKGRYILQLLYIGGDEGEAVRYSAGKGRSHSDYEYWKMLFNRHGESYTPLAVTTAMPGGVVMRWHDPRSGRRERVVIEGRDPLHFRAGAVEWEILHVAPVEIPLHDRDPGGEVFRVSFYLRTPTRLREHDVRSATLALRRRLGLRQIFVHAANEPWFLADPRFPVVYRFDASFRVPSHKEWMAAAGALCGINEEEIFCSGQY